MADDNGNGKGGPTLHIPLAFLWVLGLAVFGGGIWMGELSSDLRGLEEWRSLTQDTRFTEDQANSLRTEMLSEIRNERSYSRALCNELRRLSLRLDEIPANDCSRP